MKSNSRVVVNAKNYETSLKTIEKVLLSEIKSPESDVLLREVIYLASCYMKVLNKSVNANAMRSYETGFDVQESDIQPFSFDETEMGGSPEVVESQMEADYWKSLFYAYCDEIPSFRKHAIENYAKSKQTISMFIENNDAVNKSESSLKNDAALLTSSSEHKA